MHSPWLVESKRELYLLYNSHDEYSKEKGIAHIKKITDLETQVKELRGLLTTKASKISHLEEDNQRL